MSVILPVRWFTGDIQKCSCLPDSADRWLSGDSGVDSASITLSCWMRTTTVTGGFIFREDPISITVGDLEWSFTGGGSPGMQVRLESFGATQVELSTAPSITINDGVWHHYLFSADGYFNVDLAIDGVLQTPYTSTSLLPNDGRKIKFDREQTVGHSLTGCISDFYWHEDYIDITVASNRQKFYNNGWIYYGDDGSGPQGTQPLVWLRDEDENFGTNYGTRANFTIVGSPVGGDCIV